MTPAVIFGSLNVASSIGAYLGLIDNVSSNVQKLVHAPFKSAISNLKSASTSSNSTNSQIYIQQALIEFNQATTLEENENLISALIGKAMCQHLLGDYANRDMTMASINDVKLSIKEKAKATTKVILKKVILGPITFPLNDVLIDGIPKNDYFDRLQKFEEYKKKALSSHI